jgi:LPXTG-motif cell wall-anchored protein
VIFAVVIGMAVGAHNLLVAGIGIVRRRRRRVF